MGKPPRRNIVGPSTHTGHLKESPPPLVPPSADSLTAGARVALAEFRRVSEPPAPDSACACTEEEHAQKDREQRERVERFIKDLRRKRQRPRLPLLPPPGDLVRPYVESLWRYFTWLRRHDPRRFLEYVTLYEQAHESVWQIPPCRRGVSLLHPDNVQGLPKASALPPRAARGGRPRDERVQSRNLFIRERRVAGKSPHEVARELDKFGYPLPPGWSDLLGSGRAKWVVACRHSETRRKFTRLISRVTKE